ncbi:hypothetical protein SAMD00019534_000210 [Acytostelium subglobosum LB1]|uniref:hypothetical protein n=1 Tax=Acytostelium subglobosum LB1 TaxID=1410327 RepID=UPI0006447C2E|nr:hypothetical protein SAMD00019534_000210 [Acytostelium subglobosum LB1]GAM16846.1 hypothetical protein SAMD00019534_000210 [Acytostelium subglobosum LB1]|eukprot:XP_012758908.1 hypothetical protein SAMD00019534_000210 [Acytostelium subglobosum LB1]
MTSFHPGPDHKGIEIPYKLQKVAYYRENTQVWFKYTPKVVKSVLIFGVAIPLFWVFATIKQDENQALNKTPRKL